jgi:hypothetical protein
MGGKAIVLCGQHSPEEAELLNSFGHKRNILGHMVMLRCN